MKTVRIALALLVVAGCALVPGHGLEPGKSTAAEVTAQMGQPALTLDGPQGGRLLYFTHWPWARLTYVATLGPDGVLRGLEQRLTYANIHAVRAGMTRDEVRRLLGPPYEVGRLPRQQREVWEYPWRHAVREGRDPDPGADAGVTLARLTEAITRAGSNITAIEADTQRETGRGTNSVVCQLRDRKHLDKLLREDLERAFSAAKLEDDVTRFVETAYAEGWIRDENRVQGSGASS